MPDKDVQPAKTRFILQISLEQMQVPLKYMHRSPVLVKVHSTVRSSTEQGFPHKYIFGKLRKFSKHVSTPSTLNRQFIWTKTEISTNIIPSISTPN